MTLMKQNMIFNYKTKQQLNLFNQKLKKYYGKIYQIYIFQTWKYKRMKMCNQQLGNEINHLIRCRKKFIAEKKN